MTTENIMTQDEIVTTNNINTTPVDIATKAFEYMTEWVDADFEYRNIDLGKAKGLVSKSGSFITTTIEGFTDFFSEKKSNGGDSEAAAARAIPNTATTAGLGWAGSELGKIAMKVLIKAPHPLAKAGAAIVGGTLIVLSYEKGGEAKFKDFIEKIYDQAKENGETVDSISVIDTEKDISYQLSRYTRCNYARVFRYGEKSG